ncbi:MAG: DUF262 domain-containing HNH endonuclease family protein [Aequorivita sp.]
MINSANARNISELLNPEKDLVYFIPKYQREYIWGKRNWELLFDDIHDNEKEHFLGSIICINNKADALDTDKLELIDGQQRMTTLSILLGALYVHLKEKQKEDPENEDLSTDLVNLKYRLVLKSDKKTLRLQPSLSGDNLVDYKYLFGKEVGIIETISAPPRAGLRKIYKAYRYFLNRLSEREKKGEDELEVFGLKETLTLLKKINSSILVKIEVNNLSDAFTLFETLNNRGVPLSPIDLIKNSFLNELEKIEEKSIDDNYNRWLSLIKNLSEDSSIQERFLRHFYNAYKNEGEINIKGRTKALRSNLIEIYDTLIKRDALNFFDRLYNSTEFYNQLIYPDNEENSKEVKNSLTDLINIGAAPSYALLLYVFEKHQLGDFDKVKLIDFLVKYFVRRNITDTPPTRDLDNIFIDVISKLHTNQAYDFSIVFEILKEKIASTTVFEDKLKGKIYDENSGATRFILCKLEATNNKTKETFVDLWARDEKGKFIWTIEHIFPQGDSIPADWIEMMANGDKNKAEEIQDEYVHQIGNLTLTGYNSQLSNYSFSRKRDRVNKEGNFVGYKNGLFLNQDLEDETEWNREKIITRGNKLIKMIIELFKIEE